MNISKVEYEDLCRRIREAWGGKLPEHIEYPLTEGLYSVINGITMDILLTLSPAKIVSMIDGGRVDELRTIAEMLIPKSVFVVEISEIRQKHASR